MGTNTEVTERKIFIEEYKILVRELIAAIVAEGEGGNEATIQFLDGIVLDYRTYAYRSADPKLVEEMEEIYVRILKQGLAKEAEGFIAFISSRLIKYYPPPVDLDSFMHR